MDMTQMHHNKTKKDK